MAEKKAQGVRFGRPQQLTAEVRDRIVSERNAGTSWPKIAAGLNADGIATAHGGKQWWVSSVQPAYRSARLASAQRHCWGSRSLASVIASSASLI